MKKERERWTKLHRRHLRVRRKVSGSPERPRLAVYRSLKHMYAQVIDDLAGRTIAAASTLTAELKTQLGTKTGNVAASKALGKLIAQRAKEKGVTKVAFDRAGYKYHGRVKALADAAREAGLEF